MSCLILISPLLIKTYMNGAYSFVFCYVFMLVDVCIDPEIVVLLIYVFVLIICLYLYLRILMMSTVVFSDTNCVVNVYCLSCW